MKSIHHHSCFPPNNHQFLLLSQFFCVSCSSPCVSFSFTARALSRLPPIHKESVGPGSGASSLSLAALTSTFSPGIGSIIHCTGTTPVSLVNLPDNQAPEKMSLLPWWCQVMDFMFASGVQVKNLGKPLKVTFTVKSSLPLMRANTQSPMGKYQTKEWSTGFYVRFVCLFWAIVVYPVNLNNLVL